MSKRVLFLIVIAAALAVGFALKPKGTALVLAAFGAGVYFAPLVRTDLKAARTFSVAEVEQAKQRIP